MNRKNDLSSTKKIALCGVFAALSIAFMYFGGLTVFDLSILVVCALMTMLIVVETGDKTAWIYVAVTGVLALLLLPSKLYALEYVFFAAVYPVMKMYFERLRPIFATLVKLSFMDMLLLVTIVLSEHVFMAGDEFFALNVVTVIVGSLFLLLYDFALTVCATFYLVKLRKRLRLKK